VKHDRLSDGAGCYDADITCVTLAMKIWASFLKCWKFSPWCGGPIVVAYWLSK